MFSRVSPNAGSLRVRRRRRWERQRGGGSEQRSHWSTGGVSVLMINDRCWGNIPAHQSISKHGGKHLLNLHNMCSLWRGKCGVENGYSDEEIMPFNPARCTILSQAARFDDSACLLLSKAGGGARGRDAAWRKRAQCLPTGAIAATDRSQTEFHI